MVSDFVQDCLNLYHSLVQVDKTPYVHDEWEDNDLVYHYLMDIGYDVDETTRLMKPENRAELFTILGVVE